MRLFSRIAWVVLALAWLPVSAIAAGAAVQAVVEPGQGSLCRAAITAAEASHHVPDAFLQAIARVESGRPDPLTGTVAPWPWTVNAEGVGSFYASKQEAVAAVRALQARGVQSMDVGCMQVNLMHHPDAFASLEQAFDPAANAAYAATFLVNLFGQTGSWPRAAAAYHSQTPTLGEDYQRRVLAEWALPDGRRDGERPARRHAAPAPVPRPEADATALAAAAPAAPPGGMAPVGRMAVMVSQPASMMRPAGVTGRNLAAYRLMPTRLAMRPLDRLLPASLKLPRPPVT